MYILKHDQITVLNDLAAKYDCAPDPVKLILKVIPALEARLDALENPKTATVKKTAAK